MGRLPPAPLFSPQETLLDLRAQLGRVVIFTHVVQRSSFSAAARELQLSPSLVSEAVSELEEELGVRLLERTTRKLRLTQHGEMLFARSEQLLAELGGALAELRSSSGRAAGVLRITSTSVLVPRLVGPVLADLLRGHGIRSELVADDQRRDLVAEGFDAGVRVGVPADSDLIARSIGSIRDVVVAAPSVVEGVDLRDFDQVRALPWIMHKALPRAVRLSDSEGRPRTLRIEPDIVVTTAEAQRTLLLAGAGASVAVGMLVQDDVDRGDLVRLLPEYELSALQVFVLLPSVRQLPLRTRLFVDALVARAKSDSARARAP